LTQFTNDIENKRSKLFPDRRRIPGRKVKYILALSLVIHIWAVAKLTKIKSVAGWRDRMTSKLNRKISPYF
jgi:hypothetical protein